VNPRRIEVIIDEVVLHGFEQHHSQAIATGLRTELATALAGWRPAAGADIDRLDSGSVRHPAAVAPHALGQAVGRHIAHVLPASPTPPKGPR